MNFLKASTFRTTTPSQGGNYKKSFLLRPSHYGLSDNCPKLIFSRPSHPSKVKTDKNQPFKDDHIFFKYKLPNITPIKTNTFFYNPQSDNCPNQSLQDYHILPKWKLTKINPKGGIVENESFQHYHTFWKSKLSNNHFQDHYILPKWTLSNISHFNTPYPCRVRIIGNQFFQDHHILPKWKL